MIKRLTKEEFILRAELVHSKKYDYSKVEYVNCDTKVCIICPEHGEFWQTPYKHLKGQGCPKCIGRNLSIEDFVKNSIAVHGHKYDYSKTSLSNCKNIEKDKVCIICPEHGEFWQRPSVHMKGCGCPKCAIENKRGKQRKSLLSTTEEFIEKAKQIHGDKYDYSKVEYIDCKTKVCIICSMHGEFWQTPSSHLKGNGCPKCHPNHKKTNEEFIEQARKIHGDKYDYSKVDYKNNSSKVCIICPEHGEFWQRPNSHISRKQGCPKCNESKLEKKVERFLIENKIQYSTQKTFEWAKNKILLRFDFFIPEKNILIECQGIQHIQPESFYTTEIFEDIIKRDRIKYEGCKKNNYKIVYVVEKRHRKKFVNFGGIYNSDNVYDTII